MRSGWLRRLVTTPGPSTAVAVAADRVAAAQAAWSGGALRLQAHAAAPLPPGAVTPAADGDNVRDRAAVTRALTDVLTRLPRRPTRVALVIPDRAATVSLVRFDTVPARRVDRDRLIRSKLRRTTPFDVDEAQMASACGRRLDGGGQELVVALARRDVIEQYEAACTAAAAHAGTVGLAGVNMVNAAVAAGAAVDGADWLLVHAAAEATTLAIVEGAHLRLFRSVEGDGGGLADVVHRTVLYYRDRLGGAGLACALLAGGAAPGAQRRLIADRLGIPVEPLADRLQALLPAAPAGAAAPDDLAEADHLAAPDDLAAPLGILLRGRAAHAAAAGS